jgi:uncharacterized protein YceK
MKGKLLLFLAIIILIIGCTYILYKNNKEEGFQTSDTLDTSKCSSDLGSRYIQVADLYLKNRNALTINNDDTYAKNIIK